MNRPISGFALVRNAIELDFPVVESIRSILPLCEEVVVNVGRSEDGTLDLIRTLDDPRVRILETDWDLSAGDRLLRTETHRAMRACRHAWGVYIQADEVLHEAGIAPLRDALQAAQADARVEGLVLRYHHIFGNAQTEAVNRRWYRREVRAVRLDPSSGIEPYRDAQGFRVQPEGRRVRARLVDAAMFHYGYLRSAAALRGRKEIDQVLYPGRGVGGAPQDPAVLQWFPGLRPFRGSHPAVVRDWVMARDQDTERRISPPRRRPGHLRFYLSDAIERATGARVFEFRNYTLI